MEVLDAAILQKFIILVKVNFCQQALYNFKMHSGVCRIIPYCHRIKTTYLTSFFILLCEAGICNSQPRPFVWPSILAPNLYLPALAPNLYLPALASNLYLPALAPNLYLPQFVFTPNLYLPSQPSLILHIPTLSPQFVFTGPGL